MNNLSIEYAKNAYGNDNQLDAKLMIKVLNIILQSSTMTEVSIKRLDQTFQLNVEDQSLFNKRFDFVDVTNKRIYEFDGDHHFNFIDHFHETYENFVMGRRRDMIKQKFIVEHGFDLVRVTGKLTVHQFIDIIIKSNLRRGQSMFIKNDDYHVVNTNDLNCELDLVEMLQTEVYRLNNEIRKLKNLNTINDKTEENETTVLSLFLDSVKDNFYRLRYVSDEYLYVEYINWHKINMSGTPMDKSKFKRELVPFMNQISYRLIKKLTVNMQMHKDRRNFRSKHHNYDDCYTYLLILDRENKRTVHQPESYKNSNYYEFTGDYFTSEEFIEIKHQIVENQKFEYEDDRQQRICDILCKMNSYTKIN